MFSFALRSSLIVIVLVNLIACGSGGAATPSASSPMASVEPAVAPATVVAKPPTEIKEITLTARCLSEPPIEDWRCNNFQMVLAEVNRALEQAGDDRRITLKIVQNKMDWDPYIQEFIQASEAGNAPDIVLIGHEYIGELAQKKLIIPLDQMIDQRPEVYNNVIDSLWPSVKFQDQRWGVLQDAEARPLYWSKPLLQKLGWSTEQIEGLPEAIKTGEFTLADLQATAQQAVDQKVVAPGAGFWHRPRRGPDFWYYYYAMGGTTVEPTTEKLVYDKQAGLAHLQFFQDLTRASDVLRPDILSLEWDDWYKTVGQAEKVLFWAGGTWNWGNWATNYVKDRGGQEYLFKNVGFGLIPAYKKGGKPVTLTHPLAYAISAQSAHPDLAFRLITAVTTDEANTRHALYSSHLGILKTQAEYEPYRADRFLTDTLYMLRYTTFIPNNPHWRVYDTVWFEAMQKIEAGELTAADAVEQIATTMQAQLGSDVVVR